MNTCFVTATVSLGMLPWSGSMKWRLLDGSPKSYLASIAGNFDIVHAIGHVDLARVSGFPFRRESVVAEPGDRLLVCQYRGPRLEEGATTLPKDGVMHWYVVEVCA